MKQALLALFILGTITAIVGWFFDRALEIAWVTRLLAPAYFNGGKALAALEDNPKRGVLPDHPGFVPILDRWPGLKNKQAVAIIGRSAAYMEFGPKVESDIELIPYDANRNELPPRWTVSAAQKTLRQGAERRAFVVGAIVFFAGVTLSTVSGLIEFLTNR